VFGNQTQTSVLALKRTVEQKSGRK